MSPDAVAFRKSLIDSLGRDRTRFHYMDRDRVVVVCPLCDGPLSLVFHGEAARADLDCHRGCPESAVVAQMR